MRAIVYIDGFNLYYSIRYTPFRWLNPSALTTHLFPTLDVQRIKYFTAPVKPHQDDAGAKTRQDIYVRALKTLAPHLEIHEGHFIRKKKRMALVLPEDTEERRGLMHEALDDPRILAPGTPKVEVWKTEEKGSDVNLASHLIADGHRDCFDVAAVLSNDGDLEFPLRYVRQELDKHVILFNAAQFRYERLAPSNTPNSSYRKIRSGALEASQFPAEMQDVRGRNFHRPPSWKDPKKR